MDVLTYPLGQLQANCYLLIKDNNCLIIDPADEASFILEEIQRRKLNLVGMIATHGHFDHVMAAGEIQTVNVETCHGMSLPLFINNNDLFLLKRLSETAKHFLGYNQYILRPKITKSLIEEKMIIGSFEFKIVYTPGHTPGSICFYFPKEKLLFSGDTIFKDGIGRFDFSYSNKQDLKKSLEILSKLPADTIIYPGHGEKTTIAACHFSTHLQLLH